MRYPELFCALALVTFGGCESLDPAFDFDGDGYPNALDCDDEDANVNPDADEVCDDGIDNDCGC